MKKNIPYSYYRLILNNRRVCVDTVPENYYLDTDGIYKQCYNLCKKCSQLGDETNNQCNECIDGYQLINNQLTNTKNCIIACNNYYYFDENNQYQCTESNECPPQYNKIISNKNECIDDCKNDDIYLYEYKNNCLDECPINIKKYEEQKLCLDECNTEQFEYNNICYNDCPDDLK